MKRFVLGILSRASRVLRRTPLARSRTLNRIQATVALWLHGSNEARVGPFVVRFDPRERVLSKRLILRGGHEAKELELMCSLVRPGDCVLDAGANVGIYSLFLSRAVGPDGVVVAVEPDPENVALLRTNIAANRCTNVIVCACALGAQTAVVELYQVEDHRAHSSLADLEHTGTSVAVPMRRGDELLAELGVRPRVAKIDVEGYEPQVLEGLGYSPEVVLFEFVSSQLEALGNEPRQLLEWLVERGYRLELVDPETGARRPEELEVILSVGARGDRVFNVLGTLDQERGA